jgi:hypothetical protein
LDATPPSIEQPIVFVESTEFIVILPYRPSTVDSGFVEEAPIDGEQYARQDAAWSVVDAAPKAARKNLLINGDFRIWQRGTSFGNPAFPYTADRWMAVSQASVNRISYSGGGYALALVSNGGQRGQLRQGIELPVVGEAGVFTVGTKLTFSVIARLPSGNLSLITRFVDSPSVSGPDDQTEVVIGAGDGTWQTYTHSWTVQGVPDVSNLCYVATLLCDTGLTMDIANVQLELGDTATDFEYRPIGEELALCQRYYYASAVSRLAPIRSSNSTLRTGQIDFPVTMRITPSITQTWSDAGAGVIQGVGPQSVAVYRNVGNTTLDVNFDSLTADAEL